jgi:hypothetical protein
MSAWVQGPQGQVMGSQPSQQVNSLRNALVVVAHRANGRTARARRRRSTHQLAVVAASLIVRKKLHGYDQDLAQSGPDALASTASGKPFHCLSDPESPPSRTLRMRTPRCTD